MQVSTQGQYATHASIEVK